MNITLKQTGKASSHASGNTLKIGQALRYANGETQVRIQGSLYMLFYEDGKFHTFSTAPIDELKMGIILPEDTCDITIKV